MRVGNVVSVVEQKVPVGELGKRYIGAEQGHMKAVVAMVVAYLVDHAFDFPPKDGSAAQAKSEECIGCLGQCNCPGRSETQMQYQQVMEARLGRSWRRIDPLKIHCD